MMSNNSCPIIYIHKGGPKYLEISIKQSLKNGNDVILVGDEKNLEIAQRCNIKHMNFDDYNTNDFEKYYIHDTRGNYGFELICFQRRFVLLEVMKVQNIERCMYIDSDILYYGNVSDELNRINNYGKYDLAYLNFSGHTTYIFSQKSLQDFCNFMLNCYNDEKLYKELLDWPLIGQHKRSDMSIFQLYKHKFSKRVFNLLEDHGDHIVYDGYINAGEGYRTLFGKKYFKIIKNKVYVYKDKKKIEIKTIHFHMHMKFYMGMIFRKQLRIFRILLFFNYIIEWSYRNVSLVRYLRKMWRETKYSSLNKK